ncbi:hypothetical protein MMC21_000086 [Puttea exsequens]|nr:hypothetical protein [Puttea exsequens]
MYNKCGAAPKLGEPSLHTWNTWYERYHRATPYATLLLLCQTCNTHLPRPCFQDSKSHRTCSGPRTCIACAIATGIYDNTLFVKGGAKKFYCKGCKEILPAEKEGGYVEQRRRARAGWGTEVDTYGAKWCRGCWMAVCRWEMAKARVRVEREREKRRRNERRREVRAARRGAA